MVCMDCCMDALAGLFLWPFIQKKKRWKCFGCSTGPGISDRSMGFEEASLKWQTKSESPHLAIPLKDSLKSAVLFSAVKLEFPSLLSLLTNTVWVH